MTLVIAIKWSMGEDDEAVLMVSDTRATTGIGIVYDVKKIHAVVSDDGTPLGIAGGAGDPALIKWGFSVIDDELRSRAAGEGGIPHQEMREIVRRIESRFLRHMRELREHGLEPAFNVVLGSVDMEGRASLYLFDSRGLAEPVHDNPGLAMVGSGLVTGGMLLLRLLGGSPDIELGLLTAFILDAVSEVDYSVGPFVGESYLMRVEENERGRRLALGPLKEEALREYKEKIAKRRELIRKLWRLCDSVGEEKIAEAFGRLVADTG